MIANEIGGVVMGSSGDTGGVSIDIRYLGGIDGVSIYPFIVIGIDLGGIVVIAHAIGHIDIVVI